MTQLPALAQQAGRRLNNLHHIAFRMTMDSNHLPIEAARAYIKTGSKVPTPEFYAKFKDGDPKTRLREMGFVL